MDNKYALGGSKVAQLHHENAVKPKDGAPVCRFCASTALMPSPTMHDHRCEDCGEWQGDVQNGYGSGHSVDY